MSSGARREEAGIPRADSSELTIHSIRARPPNLDLRNPVETSSGTLATAALVLVDVFTREGVVGCSYASVYSPTRSVRSQAGSGTSPTCSWTGVPIPQPSSVLRGHFRLLGLTGLIGVAIGAIDMALWDAWAKAAGCHWLSCSAVRPSRSRRT